MDETKIVWDEPKRQLNLAKHGFDFADITVDFFAQAVFVPARSGRYLASGPFKTTWLAVVFAPLGTEAIALVSARRASPKERMIYEKGV